MAWPLPRLGQPQRSDLGQQGQGFVRGSIVHCGLYGRVVQLPDAADDGPTDIDRHDHAVRVEVDPPQHRRADPTGQQARRPFGQRPRVQRDPQIGAVDGDPAGPGGGIQRSSRPDESGHVGDGVADAVAAAPAGQVHRLVQVPAPGWVEGHEGQFGLVARRQHRLGGGPLGLGQGFGWELLGYVELPAYGGEVEGWRTQPAGRHSSTVTTGFDAV